MFPHERCSFAVVKFSLWAGNRAWPEIVDLTAYVESVGWHGFWLPDHYMSQTGDDSSGTEPALDCWTVLAAVAVAVPNLRLTSMDSPVTIHHPVVLAKRVVTVDQISNGRAVFGLGAGWQVNERFMAACEKEGRDPATIRRSEQALVYITDSDSKREELLAKVNSERAIVSPAEIVDVMSQYADAGLDEFALPDFNLGASSAKRRETIERFHEEVVSKVST